MLENKKQDNIKNVIIDYFKMINQLSYKDISVRLNKEIGVCIIVVQTESQRDMFPYVTPKNGRSPQVYIFQKWGKCFHMILIFFLIIK